MKRLRQKRLKAVTGPSKTTVMSSALTLVLQSDAILALAEDRITCRASDGCVNLTELCKAGRKAFKHWSSNQRSKAFLEALSSAVGIPAAELVKLGEGRDTTGATSQTWGHPQVAIHIAQWISPEFSVKVSRWVYELAATGKVVLGEEKSAAALDEIWLTRIRALESQLEAKDRQLSVTESAYHQLQEVHESRLLRHNYYKFKHQGPALYLATSGLEYEDGISRAKLGIAGCRPTRKLPCKHCKHQPDSSAKEPKSIDDRVASHRGLWPALQIKFLVYTPDAAIIEKALKRTYRDNINPSGHEIIEGVDPAKIIETIQAYLDLLNKFHPESSYQIEGNIEIYNRAALLALKQPNQEQSDPKAVKEDLDEKTIEEEAIQDENQWLKLQPRQRVPQDLRATHKKCSKCLFVKPHDLFNKCSTHKDGLTRYCKSCCKMKRAEFKENQTPPEGHETRQCSDCDEILPICDFYAQTGRKDGYTKQCKSCYSEMLKERGSLGKTEEPDERKRCSKCKETKPSTAFHSNRRMRDGLNSRCMKCANKSSEEQRMKARSILKDSTAAT